MVLFERRRTDISGWLVLVFYIYGVFTIYMVAAANSPTGHSEEWVPGVVDSPCTRVESDVLLVDTGRRTLSSPTMRVLRPTEILYQGKSIAHTHTHTP